MEYWHYVETTESGQPLLRESEKDILIDHNVGLYQGKERIRNRQNGRIFLTSQRIIYVDSKEPTKYSLGIELDDIDHLDYSSSFLRRSARLIIFMDVHSASSGLHNINNKLTEEVHTTTWVCPICMVTNETEGEFKANTQPPPVCVNCGVPADYELTKNSITIQGNSTDSNSHADKKENKNSCSACTFINHPQVRNCEICGTRLNNTKIRNRLALSRRKQDSRLTIELDSISSVKSSRSAEECFIQVSFRKSDGILFSDAVEKTITDLKASTKFNRNTIEKTDKSEENGELNLLETKLSKIGITSLEHSRENQILNNDIIFTSALTDLDKLISLADSIERLYRKESIDNQSVKKPNLILDRDTFYNKEQFLSEVSREIYDFVKNGFKNNYVMITLVDLYALYNKSMRIGTGLISPAEMREACEKFGSFGLSDLYLKKINGCVLCVCTDDAFDYIRQKIIDIIDRSPGADLLTLTQKFNDEPNNNWGIGVIQEVLKSCIDEGQLLIDKQISGIYYYCNNAWKL